jgi:hypothetical protein
MRTSARNQIRGIVIEVKKGTTTSLRSHRHGIARTQRTIRSCTWQCDKQGADVRKSSGVGCSVSHRLRKANLRGVIDPFLDLFSHSLPREVWLGLPLRGGVNSALGVIFASKAVFFEYGPRLLALSQNP